MTEAELRQKLVDRVTAVEERLAAACRRAGRNRADVTLLCVTKSVSPTVAAALYALGQADLGESRPQELWRKAAVLPPGVRWHLIGHLQRNKVEETLPLVHLIHSVDSQRLLEALEANASKRRLTVPVLLEVNASREAQKHGFAPEGVPDLLPGLEKLRHVEVHGFMTMAALEGDPELARSTFASLRRLRDWLAGRVEPPHRLEHLSMGMTHDFEVAVEEGATIVRIGTALFDGLEDVP